MTVAQLIKNLQTLDQTAEVEVYSFPGISRRLSYIYKPHPSTVFLDQNTNSWSTTPPSGSIYDTEKSTNIVLTNGIWSASYGEPW